MTAGGAKLGYDQIETFWEQAGGPPSAAPLMAAIALAESGGWTDAVAGAAPGSPAKESTDANGGSYGLWQINGSHAGVTGAPPADGGPVPPQSWVQQMFNPLDNAKEAIKVWGGGSGLGAWSTYNSGAYQAFLGGGPTSYQGAVEAAQLTAQATAKAATKGYGSQYDGLVDPTKPVISLPGLFGNITLLDARQMRTIRCVLTIAAGVTIALPGVAIMMLALGLKGPAQRLAAVPGIGAVQKTALGAVGGSSGGATGAAEGVGEGAAETVEAVAAA